METEIVIFLKKICRLTNDSEKKIPHVIIMKNPLPSATQYTLVFNSIRVYFGSINTVNENMTPKINCAYGEMYS